MNQILKVDNASFSYNGKEKIFEGINLEVNKSDVLCILGPNGTGKSTLIKCINGLLNLDSGNIFLNSTNISEMAKTDLAKMVGYIPQSHSSTFAFSVFDVVLMGRAPHLNVTSVPGRKDFKIADKAIESLGISYLKDKTYTEISGGEKQMVLLARVLAQEPKLLLLDEPTSHLDFGNQIRTLDVINRLSQNGLSIVMTSHYPDHAFLSSNKVAIMKDGGIMDIGEPESVVTEENMRKTYGIDVKVIDMDDSRKACIPMQIK
jgi:iron complex transport system ATP-binding protein